jgi:16S rRNA processing protein RimM
VSAPAQGDELIELAAVVRGHGLNGELLLKLFNPDSDQLARSPYVVLRPPTGELRRCEVTSLRGGGDAHLLALRGIESRDQADALRGSVVCVPRSALPALDDGEYYLVDLVGLAVRDASGAEIGRVESVIEYPSVQCLVVVTNGEWLEVPDLPRYVLEVQVAEGYVVVDHLDEIDTVTPPPGKH